MATLSSKSWIVTLPIAGAAAAYVWFFFLPTQKAIAELQLEVNEKQSFTTNRELFTSQSREAQVHFDAACEYVKRQHETLVAPADLPRLYAEIAAVAKEAGVVTTRFSPDPPMPFAQVDKYPVNLGCEGSFQQVCRLIEGLERLPYQVWYEYVTFETEGETGQTVRCELNLEVFAKKSGSSG